MKNRFKYLVPIIIVMLFICAFLNNKKEKPSDNIVLTQEIFASFTHGILDPDPEIRNLVYDGKNVTVQYNILNGEQDASFGLLIFTNGVLQPFCINDGSDTTMYRFNVLKNQSVTFPISFDPVQLNEKENTVYFLLMLDPDFYPEDKTQPFGHNHSISQLLPWKLVNNSAGSRTSKINIASIENFQQKQIEKSPPEFDQKDQKSDSPLELNINSECPIELNNNAKKISVPLNISSKINGKYRVSVFINHEPINAFDGCDYIDIDCDKDTNYKLTVNIDSSDLKDSNNFAYAIAVPVDYNFDGLDIQVAKSASVILINQ
ncbi:hypothetical protein [Syntrophomonas wolfei]|uniref:hypothetical protein n=1 Tax=Syntrophomonas wolfei TaxID=863 RepID=UPI0023F189D5|nr:hypothetical protein [Syntrophomonas wolfei]